MAEIVCPRCAANLSLEGDICDQSLLAERDVLRGQVEALERALEELCDQVRIFREYAGRHEGMHDSDLRVCSRCNESYIGAESRLDAAREAARKLLEEKGSD